MNEQDDIDSFWNKAEEEQRMRKEEREFLEEQREAEKRIQEWEQRTAFLIRKMMGAKK